jgi:hypothetical protein
MAKITYPTKTNDPNAPDNEKKFSYADANEIKDVVNQNDTHIINFTSEISLDKKYISEHLMTGPIHYTFSNVNTPELGIIRRDYVIVDGVNKPTFDETNFVVRFDNFLNETNRMHRIFFEYIGNNKVMVEMVYI